MLFLGNRKPHSPFEAIINRQKALKRGKYYSLMSYCSHPYLIQKLNLIFLTTVLKGCLLTLTEICVNRILTCLPTKNPLYIVLPQSLKSDMEENILYCSDCLTFSSVEKLLI